MATSLYFETTKETRGVINIDSFEQIVLCWKGVSANPPNKHFDSLWQPELPQFLLIDFCLGGWGWRNLGYKLVCRFYKELFVGVL